MLPFPSPGDLPDPGIELWSPALQADSLPSESLGKPKEGEEMTISEKERLWRDPVEKDSETKEQRNHWVSGRG